MVPLIAGLAMIGFMVFAALPAGLGWGAHILAALKGVTPIGAAFLGLLLVFVGIADLKDAAEAKNEERRGSDRGAKTGESEKSTEKTPPSA